MGISAMHAAATGMKAMDTKLNVVANNIANIGTVGFKRSRASFEDLLYQAQREPGLPNAADEPTPYGIQVGLGVKLAGTELDFTQGSPDVTDGAYDIAIQGQGFFQVRTYLNGEQVTAYTRAGNFTTNANGNLVLGNSVGSMLEPQIAIPDGEGEVQIGENGTVTLTLTGQPTQEIGQIELARFANPKGLVQIGKNMFLESDASGAPVTGNPGENGLGTLLPGSLEMSNADPVRELVEMIRTQRYFEMNSQVIQTADEAMSTVAQLKR